MLQLFNEKHEIELRNFIMIWNPDSPYADPFYDAKFVSCLYYAAILGLLEACKDVMDNGADINARAENNQAALDLALTRGHQEIVALLEELGAKLS